MCMILFTLIIKKNSKSFLIYERRRAPSIFPGIHTGIVLFFFCGDVFSKTCHLYLFREYIWTVLKAYISHYK